MKINSTISSLRPKVVIDTNVFLSGLFFGGNPEKILRLWQAGRIEVLLSPELAAEIILKTKKFNQEQKFLEEWAYILNYDTTHLLVKETVSLCRDPKDNMLLSLAKQSKADYLITGDKDLLSLKTLAHTHILTPREFLDTEMC